MNSKNDPIDQAKLRHEMEVMNRPFDPATLVAAGLIEKAGRGEYRLLKPVGELPEEAQRRIRAAGSVRNADGSSSPIVRFTRRKMPR